MLGPGIGGEVTFATARPVARNQVMSILEMLLRWNNATLVYSEGRYHVLPLESAIPRPPFRYAAQPRSVTRSTPKPSKRLAWALLSRTTEPSWDHDHVKIPCQHVRVDFCIGIDLCIDLSVGVDITVTVAVAVTISVAVTIGIAINVTIGVSIAV